MLFCGGSFIILDRLHLEQNRQNMQTISTALRTHFGQDAMSRVMMEDIKSAQAPVIIIEGIRRPSDLENLKQIPNFHLIAITADARTRFERLTLRNENPDDQSKTWESFQQDAAREAEQEVGAITKEAQFIIENNADKETLFTRVEEVLNTLSQQ